jgi:ATP-dependent Clp protease ATP-binding subunit ClpB
VQRLVQDPLAMRILDGSVLPGDLVRVDIDPNSDSMKFERTEQAATQDGAAKAPAAEPAATAAKSGRRR